MKRIAAILVALFLTTSLVSCIIEPARTDRKEPENQGDVVVPGLSEEESTVSPSIP